MQIRVIKHIRKVYGCRGCETAPFTVDKSAQLIEKSMAQSAPARSCIFQYDGSWEQLATLAAPL